MDLAMYLQWHQVSLNVTFSNSSCLSSVDKIKKADEQINPRCTDIWGKAHAHEPFSDFLSLRFHYESEQFENLQII